jgi:hypothetical protein
MEGSYKSRKRLDPIPKNGFAATKRNRQHLNKMPTMTPQQIEEYNVELQRRINNPTPQEQEQDRLRDIEYEAMDQIARHQKISVSWSIDGVDAAHMYEPHTFGTVKWIKTSNPYCGGCRNRRVLMKGTRWVDIWKCFDKLKKTQEKKVGMCDHNFMEMLSVVDGNLIVHCGS